MGNGSELVNVERDLTGETAANRCLRDPERFGYLPLTHLVTCQFGTDCACNFSAWFGLHGYTLIL